MAVVASATGAAVFGLSGVAAGLAGGALLGAGAGALYSGITGDGNILNSALTGGLLGAGIGGLGAALAPAAAGGTAATGATSAVTAAAAPSTALAPTANVLTAVPAATTSVPTATSILASPAAPIGLTGTTTLAPGAASVAPTAGGFGLKAPTLASGLSLSGSSAGGAGAGLTTGEVLGYGLAGSAALSLLGGMNQPKLSSTPQGTNPAYIRPYTYSQTKNPNYGQPGQSYYNQGYTAQPTYKAAAGGLMGANGSFLAQDEQAMYPQSQMDKTQYAVSSQMPTGAEVVGSDYDARTNAFTGMPTQRFADGGQTGLPLQQNVQAPLDIAINPQTDQRQIVAPIQMPTTQYTPQSVPDPNRFNNAYVQYQYESAVAPKPAPTAQVLDYAKILNQRAADEYINSPTPAAFKAAPPPPPPPPAPSPEVQAAERAKVIAALPKNQSTFNEAAYLAAFPDVAAQIGRPNVESAWAHYQNYGQKEGRNALFDVIPTAGFGVGSTSGLPGYQYNAATKSYSPVNQAPTPDMSSPDIQEQFNQLMRNYQAQQTQPAADYNQGGGAAGGLMPSSLKYAMGGATGYNLGGYSDGGRLLKGPGDGMSDNIPASVGDKQPARLADGEFVVPADVVSHLGNGSTDAGAKKLYSMMDNVRKARTGNKKQGKQIKADKYLKA